MKIDPVALSDSFKNAVPFPHIIVDGAWDNEYLLSLAAEFPAGNDPRWITYPDPKEWGKRAGAVNMWGPQTQRYFEQMRSPEMCQWLEKLTGIGPLVADDIGGGMHMTGEGGRLDMHVDFNVHPAGHMERRLNVLTFLNDEWNVHWGGTLYLGEHAEIAVVPQLNRTVIFETSEHSWHGHPDPILGDHWRKSLAVYYYAPLREQTAPAHSTIWHH